MVTTIQLNEDVKKILVKIGRETYEDVIFNMINVLAKERAKRSYHRRLQGNG